MIDEIRPIGLKEVSLTLGLDPLEVVRLLVLAQAFPEGELALTPDHVARLREVGGIEFWWDDSPTDPRELVQAMLGHLLSRGYVGESSTRLGNLWRGLQPAQAQTIQHAVNLLLQAGLLATFPHPSGVRIAGVAGAADQLTQAAAGQTELAALAPLWS